MLYNVSAFIVNLNWVYLKLWYVYHNYNYAIAKWLPSIAINKSKGLCCIIITDTRNRSVLAEENLKYEYLLPVTCSLKENIANSFVKPVNKVINLIHLS